MSGWEIQAGTRDQEGLEENRIEFGGCVVLCIGYHCAVTGVGGIRTTNHDGAMARNCH